MPLMAIETWLKATLPKKPFLWEVLGKEIKSRTPLQESIQADFVVGVFLQAAEPGTSRRGGEVRSTVDIKACEPQYVLFS